MMRLYCCALYCPIMQRRVHMVSGCLISIRKTQIGNDTNLNSSLTRLPNTIWQRNWCFWYNYRRRYNATISPYNILQLTFLQQITMIINLCQGVARNYLSHQEIATIIFGVPIYHLYWPQKSQGPPFPSNPNPWITHISIQTPYLRLLNSIKNREK